MRYTECKLTSAAMLLLDGIDEDAVDFKPTYDGQDEEPVVLPAGFPNLLANGSSGIAVGMATSIPPHNAAELIDACQMLLAHPEATTADLMTHVKGPDFPDRRRHRRAAPPCSKPTRPAAAACACARAGSRRTRPRDLPDRRHRGALPGEEGRAGRTAGRPDREQEGPLLGDVRDESAEDVRLVIEPKSRNIEPEVLMESLFKLSDLETRFSVNMNVLDARGTPGVMGLKQPA
jgi:topoisomerase-4 subunit A